MPTHRARFAVAVHLFLVRGDEILLLRRFNTGFRDGFYGVVAGHLDGGEPGVAAAIREAQEEVGIDLAAADLTVVGVMHRWEGEERIDFFLTAERWRGEIVNAEPEKCDEVAWCPLDSLPGNTVPYVAQAITNHRRGVWFDSFGWEAERPDPIGGADSG